MKSYPATLRKVGTDVVHTGSFFWFPLVNTSFVFSSDDMDQVLRTSTVKSVRFAEGRYYLNTLNSTYELVPTPAITPVRYFVKPVEVDLG